MASSEFDGIVSPAYAVFKINERVANRRFIHHRLRSHSMRSKFRSRSKGIIESRLRLYPDAFLANEDPASRPKSAGESSRFSRPRDRQNRRVDREKRKFLKKNELRRKVIALNVLSQGLKSFEWNADTQTIEFLYQGKRWETRRVKYLVSFMTSRFKRMGRTVIR